MRKLALVCAGGFCGALTRYLLAAPILALAARLPRLPGMHTGSFPYDVLLINLTGALALGVIYGLVERRIHVAHDLRLLLGTGFLGAYTTFSSYVYGGVQLLLTGAWFAGALYLVGSLAVGLLSAQLGFWLAGALSQPQRQPAVIRAMGTPVAEALASLNRRLTWDDTGPLLAREPGRDDDEQDTGDLDNRDDRDDLREEELM